MPEARQVTCVLEGEALVFQLTGALDHVSALEVIEQIQQTFPDRRGRVVLDLTRVTFVRSSGIGGVVQISFDHDLRVVCGEGDVRKTFELAEAHRVVQFMDGMESALESFA